MAGEHSGLVIAVALACWWGWQIARFAVHDSLSYLLDTA